MKYFIPFYFILPLVKGEFDDVPLLLANIWGSFVILLYGIVILINM